MTLIQQILRQAQYRFSRVKLKKCIKQEKGEHSFSPQSSPRTRRKPFETLRSLRARRYKVLFVLSVMNIVKLKKSALIPYGHNVRTIRTDPRSLFSNVQ